MEASRKVMQSLKCLGYIRRTEIVKTDSVKEERLRT